MRLIQSSLDDGNPVAINVPGIAYARELDDGSEAVFRDGATATIGASFAELRAKIAVTIELALLTDTSGATIAVNPEAVAYAQPADDGGLIVFDGGASITTRDSYEQIMAAFGSPLPDGDY